MFCTSFSNCGVLISNNAEIYFNECGRLGQTDIIDLWGDQFGSTVFGNDHFRFGDFLDSVCDDIVVSGEDVNELHDRFLGWCSFIYLTESNQEWNHTLLVFLSTNEWNEVFELVDEWVDNFLLIIDTF